MADYRIEVSAAGQFVRWAEQNDSRAWQAIMILRPEMFEDAEVRDIWVRLTERFAAGSELLDATDDPTPAYLDVMDGTIGQMDLVAYAERIRTNWRAREQCRILRLGIHEAEKAIPSENGKARRVAERLTSALLDLHADTSDGGRLHDMDSILDAELAAMDAPQDGGVPLPYRKLEEECGPAVPGDVYGISAFSNGGKSTLAANLAYRFARRGTPVLAFPTEMRERWVSRTAAAASGVPQWIAEKRQWSRASDHDRDAFRAALTDFRRLPMQIVNRPNVSPAEIVAATRVLRKRWSGQTVVVIVDHMHRLDYGGEDPNEAVGPGTKLLKNFAGDDRDGGLIFLLLFQPRKPERDVYRPIAGHQIRGNSMVWNELDVHLSPFRTWVKTDDRRLTPWGTPAAKVDPSGRPHLAEPEAEGAKLCDEHVFLKVDKRRVGGEGGTLWLPFDQPSGCIYEIPGGADELQ
jgi:replicative DNA helicase